MAEIKEKEAAYKVVTASRAGPRIQTDVREAPATAATSAVRVNVPLAEEVESEWFRGRSRNRVNLSAGFKVSGARHLHADLFTTGEDCELDVAPAMCPTATEVVLAMCVVAIDEDSNSRRAKTVHFELV